jgi:hypothetical protein
VSINVHDQVNVATVFPDFCKTLFNGINVTDGVPEGVTEGVPEGVTEGVPEGVPEGVTEGVTEGVPEGVPEGVTEGVTNGVGVTVGTFELDTLNEFLVLNKGPSSVHKITLPISNVGVAAVITNR